MLAIQERLGVAKAVLCAKVAEQDRNIPVRTILRTTRVEDRTALQSGLAVKTMLRAQAPRHLLGASRIQNLREDR